MGDRAARSTRRYLNLLRDALLDAHYLENELRIEHLLRCVSDGQAADSDKLANPGRYMSGALRQLRQRRDSGELPRTRAEAPSSDGLAYAGLGRNRLDHLETCLDAIRDEAIAGHLVEFGTGRGGAAIFMRGFLEAHELTAPRVWVADRFDRRASAGNASISTFPPDLNSVREGFARFGLLDERTSFLQGPPSQTLAEAPIVEVALLRVDTDDPQEVQDVLDAVYDRIVPGGFVVIDDYGNPECRTVVDGFRSQRDVAEPLERIDWSAAAWRKAREGPADARAYSRRGLHPAEDSGSRAATKDLGVVVVIYNMRREAARMLHSLSRSYQRGIEDLDYEVIVVENGSDPGQRLGEEFVCSFGTEFRYIDLAAEASPSPSGAINRGIAASTGAAMALMIDGAHVLTPGVLRNGMLGLSAYAPALVTAMQWYVGPGQQPDAVAGGYDREFEDRLFAEIEWPTDGYRLFEIGHFIGDRDWFDGEWESNCIFVPRDLIDQVGAMEERFSTPGGGFANLDFFERMVGTPGVTPVTMLGEGSFHQVHGGTTTNLAEPGDLIRSYDEQYEELRGHRFQVPPQETHYVGSFPPAAKRTKPRLWNNFQLFRNAHVQATDRRPVRPLPVPQELKTEFIDAFWRSGEWHRTTWMGKWTHRAPTDLLVYQELVARLRPDWIIQTRTGAGGLALFLASICDLIDHGGVLSIDGYPLSDPPEHPRITYLCGDPADQRTGDQAQEVVEAGSTALVILGAAAGPELMAAFRNYAPLVPIGSYVIVEDTVLGGRPVWSAFGSRPGATVQEIAAEGEFVRDPSLERFALTFNVGGYLKRVR